MRLRDREDGRRKSASTRGLAEEERARLKAMTSLERMSLALRLGRALGKGRPRTTRDD